MMFLTFLEGQIMMFSFFSLLYTHYRDGFFSHAVGRCILVHLLSVLVLVFSMFYEVPNA